MSALWLIFKSSWWALKVVGRPKSAAALPGRSKSLTFFPVVIPGRPWTKPAGRRFVTQFYAFISMAYAPYGRLSIMILDIRK